jgi:hypothetical protein
MLCNVSPITGIRYRSLVVTEDEYNLCQTCFWSGTARGMWPYPQRARSQKGGARTIGVETDLYKRHHAVMEYVRPETRVDRMRYMMRIKYALGVLLGGVGGMGDREEADTCACRIQAQAQDAPRWPRRHHGRRRHTHTDLARSTGLERRAGGQHGGCCGGERRPGTGRFRSGPSRHQHQPAAAIGLSRAADLRRGCWVRWCKRTMMGA